MRLESEVDVGADEEVEISVPISVEEDRAGGPNFIEGEPGGFGDIFEGAISSISVEPVDAEIRHEQVGVSISIEVSDGDPHPVVRCRKSLRGDFEPNSTLLDEPIEEQKISRGLTRRGGEDRLGDRAIEGSSLSDEEIEVAIAVSIEKRAAGTHHFAEVPFAGHPVGVVEREVPVLRSIDPDGELCTAESLRRAW